MSVRIGTRLGRHSYVSAGPGAFGLFAVFIMPVYLLGACVVGLVRLVADLIVISRPIVVALYRALVRLRRRVAVRFAR